MTKKKTTRKAFVEYLNEIGKSLDRDKYIIGGKLRPWYKPYGYLLRKFDPIAFNVAYNDWKREQNG
jgi:hypothetical protein